MNNAIIFISYHPGSLVVWDYFREIDKGRSLYVLILCRHTYVTQEVIDLYSDRYDHIIVLPDIHYEKNIIKGFIKYFRFIINFSKRINPILAKIDSFSIISDCSAYLPVNTLISKLKKNNKFKKLISNRDIYASVASINIPMTLLAAFYTKVLRLYPVRSYKGISYLYKNEPQDMNIKLINPYEQKGTNIRSIDSPKPSFNIVRTALNRKNFGKNIIIFYSDRQLEEYGSSLSSEEHKNRIQKFFVQLLKYYKNHKIICKPHPLDQGKVMAGMENVEYTLYKGGLTSQIHLHMNNENVKACYSVASTSLFYSASLGIPSYTLYKYLEYNNEYPKIFFETDTMQQIPFLYNIINLEEIGIIDSVSGEPITDECIDDTWNGIIYSGTGMTS